MTLVSTKGITDDTIVKNIGCREQGLFDQRAGDHLAGHGCLKCPCTVWGTDGCKLATPHQAATIQ